MEPTSDIQAILAQLGPGATREQIISALMQNFTSGINKAKDSTKTAYQEAIEAIQGYYDQAAVGRGQDFQSNFDVLGDNLANLGENFSEGGLGASYAADQQYITEAADSALATDLAWFEKMQANQADLYNAMIIEMAAQMALQNVAQVAPVSSGGGGSGGGGRSSGGGGGSSSSSAFDPDTGVPLGTQDLQITANEDTKYYTPAFDQAVENLRGTGDPVNIQMADDIDAWRRRVGTGGVVGIMQEIQEKNDLLDNSRGRTPVGPNTSEIPLNVLQDMSEGPYFDIADPWYRQELTRASAPGDADYNRQLMDFLTPFNPNFGPVVTLEQVNRDGKWNQNDAKNQPMPGFGVEEDPGDWNEQGVWENPQPFRDFLRANAAEVLSRGQNQPRYEDERFSLWTGPEGNIMSGPLSDMDYSKGERRTRNEYNRGPANDPVNPANPFSINAREDISGALSHQGALGNIADMSTPQSDALANQEMFDNARRAQDQVIQAAAERKRREQEQARLAAAAQTNLAARQTSMGRPQPVANNAKPVTATQSNPHPMGTGTFGQTVRTGTPFYVANPKPKTKRPSVGTRYQRPV